MSLNKPVPEGGTPNYLAVLSDDAHEMTDRKLLEGSDTWDVASLAPQAQESKDFEVEGAALGDFVLVGPGVDVEDMLVSGVVTAAGVVTVTIANETAATPDLASSTWRVLVIGQGS